MVVAFLWMRKTRPLAESERTVNCFTIPYTSMPKSDQNLAKTVGLSTNAMIQLFIFSITNPESWLCKLFQIGEWTKLGVSTSSKVPVLPVIWSGSRVAICSWEPDRVVGVWCFCNGACKQYAYLPTVHCLCSASAHSQYKPCQKIPDRVPVLPG